MDSITETRDEILQLLYRYNHAIDSGDAEGWAALFTDDGVFEVAGQVMSGREAMVGFASGVNGLRHVVANPVVEVVGDTATVQAYLFAFGGTTMVISGSYEDQLVRKPDGWRFAKRSFTPDPPR
jgi:ketosteroid isomerase-like protein